MKKEREEGEREWKKYTGIWRKRENKGRERKVREENKREKG